MAAHRQDRARKKAADAKSRPRRGKPKVCLFCAHHIEWVDYKDTAVLRRFLNDRGRIKARHTTGTCAQHQRDVAIAIKTARELALLPYTVRTLTTEKSGGRSGFGRAGRGRDSEAAAVPAAAADGTGEGATASDLEAEAEPAAAAGT